MTNTEKELREKLALLQDELDRNDDDRQSIRAKVHEIMVQLSDKTCDNCIAGLDGFMSSAGEFCEDCARYHCIYCRKDDCDDFVPINSALNREDLNTLSEHLSFEILKAINLHPEKMKTVLDLLKDLELL